MCGISGIITSEDKRVQLERMLFEQHHRGPDHTGIYCENGFALIGHNRLSIIDLSDAANQPFQDTSGRYSLSFNGEIYNYRELREELKDQFHFRTSSDTEVLLACYLVYGRNCLERLNGMFSFAIWDSKEKHLFAARDRFGVKPFFYSIDQQDLYFSSEIKAIKAVLKREKAATKVWANYFAFGSYGFPEETFFEGIHQLPAGHFLEFSKGKLRTEKWYDFVRRIRETEIVPDFEKTKEKYLDLLLDSISLRFRADVKVGFNVSGGIDSSLLLALVNREKPTEKIRAYTFYTGDERYDELPWVEKMISSTGNPLTCVALKPEEVNLLASEISVFQDEPYGGIPTIAYSKIFDRAKKDNVLVLLDGQGMDEQWAGYDYYGKSHDMTIQGQTDKKSPFKINVLSQDMLRLAEKPEYPAPFENDLQNLQYRDLFYTKIPRALRFNDRISMASSTELREPFLDHRLVEFAFAQPNHYKIRDGIHKYLLRDLIKDLVPAEISYAPKRPLQTPQREWLGHQLKDFVDVRLKILKEKDISGWFDHNEIEKEWKAFLAGENKSSFHIWQWVNTSFINVH
ncbi:asparagine synthase (glutamine-hydrolyzing) [Salinimicrobium sediminilitoris]|uniref:asparagine synthase (glutamine-hydrolyzing) n=1 Tax=Salinimicrobium sediminilitoris TaxID=2876715 RepID=UPI001E3F919A|nr:asparagine synthase (glutamine-hydrolyzing) [Salinimicrobium sediminilitoris]MCC8358534.1 asparagine synthase (glutamine-hydrolyzing) [Salinimicrobium sediminilitoris]